MHRGAGYNQNIMGMRKMSKHAADKQKSIEVYRAPVVKERYKKVISHFNKTK